MFLYYYLSSTAATIPQLQATTTIKCYYYQTSGELQINTDTLVIDM